jgi:membrane-bound lytic murein transglycosylase D
MIVPYGVNADWFISTPPEKKPLVESYEQIFLHSDARDRIVSAFDMARYYLPFVQSVLAANSMPAELAYLPILESGYNPRATSPSGAAGIWQFMLNTSGDFGMRVDDRIDE